MKLSFKNYRRVTFVLASLYFILGYLLINWINSQRAISFNVSFRFETNIPFIPIFILGYGIVYLSVLGLYFIIRDEREYKRTIIALFMLVTIHYIFFLLIPVKMTMRPEFNASSSLMLFITKTYYTIDKPFNCFPSLHVSYTFLGAFLLYNYKRLWSYFYFILAIIVAVSVILVKQHYVADVVVGIITAGTVAILSKKIARKNN